MNGLYSKEMLVSIIKLVSSKNLKLYSPSIGFAGLDEYDVFPTFDSRIDVGKYLHKFYTHDGWFLLLDVASSKYGLSVTERFSKSCNGFIREAVDVYLSKVISNSYGLTIGETSSKSEDMKIMCLTDSSEVSEEIINIVVSYIQMSRARIKDCSVEFVGKSYDMHVGGGN